MDYRKSFLEDLKSSGALLEGHFVLSSGLHSAQYIQCARLLQYPGLAGKYLSFLAKPFGNSGVSAVMGPALGGVIPAYEIARSLKCRALFTERAPSGEMALRRGFSLREGERILVAEDVITTGKSALEVLELAENYGGVPAGVCALIDRSGGAFKPHPVSISIINLEIGTWPAGECPLCLKGVPAEKPGSRKETLKS